MAIGRARPWVAVAGVVAIIAAVMIACQFAPDTNGPKRLTDDAWVTGQITTAQVPAIRAAGFRTIVNMRIDNEAPGQPDYAEMMYAVQGAKLAYGYVPLRKGPLAPVQIEALMSALSRLPKPALLYGEPREHVARAWALAEASKAGGLDAASILSSVNAVGPSTENIDAQVESRIAGRKKE
ncbi:MAG: sulfur transferase domain-containing protein [Rhodanobacteraceae bacterium]